MHTLAGLKHRIVITDNCTEKSCHDLNVPEQALEDLKKISDRRIDSLEACNLSNLLVFPYAYKDCSDDLGSAVICSIKDNKISTYNTMGFVGVGSTALSIRSRFTPHTRQDYFLYYMLFKILSVNIMQLRHDFERSSLRELIICFFPIFLEDALRQGIYREYTSVAYDNNKVRGSVDVARQIKRHMPFSGKIACNTREHNLDNRVTQLIRHTLEYIQKDTAFAFILKEHERIRQAVGTIKQVTGSYSRSHLKEVLYKNLRPLSHPYFTAYTRLHRLCMQILQQDVLMYGMDHSDIYGILFDGAWLWEEYLNTVLKDFGFTHALNKRSKNGVNLFINGHTMYPDFYSTEHNLVLDAKYKRLDKREDNKDLQQLVCYMHILHSRAGAFIYPSSDCADTKSLGTLNGYGGSMYKIPFFIDQKAASMQDFVKKMEESEQKFCDSMARLFNI